MRSVDADIAIAIRAIEQGLDSPKDWLIGARISIDIALREALTQPTPQPTEENCFLGGAELSPMKYVRIQAMTASGSSDCPTKEETCATPGGIAIGSAPCPDCPPCGLCGDTGFSARLAGKHYESIPCPNGCKPREV